MTVTIRYSSLLDVHTAFNHFHDYLSQQLHKEVVQENTIDYADSYRLGKINFNDTQFTYSIEYDPDNNSWLCKAVQD